MRDLDNYLQYRYALAAVSKRRRFSKWAKKVQNDALTEAVAKLYSCSLRRAASYANILSDEQAAEILAAVPKKDKQ